MEPPISIFFLIWFLDVTFSIQAKDRVVKLNIGEYVITVQYRDEGLEVPLLTTVKVQIREGRTYLPFRRIAEAFEAEVDYSIEPGTERVERVWFIREWWCIKIRINSGKT